MCTELVENKNLDKLSESISLAKNIITKDYLYQLGQYDVVELSDDLKDPDGEKIVKRTRFYKINKLVSDKNESVIDKLVTVLNAAYTSNSTVVVLIEGTENSVNYYVGIVDKDVNENANGKGKVLENALKGNFPGLETQNVIGDSKRELLKNVFADENATFTSISGIASIRNEKTDDYDKYVQGIEHLVDSMQGMNYRILTIADPVKTDQLENTRLGYESLYTQISPFLNTQISFNETENLSSTLSHTENITNTIGKSISLTQNYAHTSGWSNGATTSKGKNVALGTSIGTLAGVAAGTITAKSVAKAAGAMVAKGVAAAIPSIGIPIQGIIAAGTAAGSLFGSNNSSESETHSESGNTTNSSGTAESNNESTSTSSGDTTSKSQGQSKGKTLQLSNENKTVRDLMDAIDKQIDRLQKCEAYGAFNSATYVISSDPQTNAIVASGFNALMRGDTSSVQASHINNWDGKTQMGALVKEYLKMFSHPLFKTPENSHVFVTPASISNSYEMAVNMAFPKKSITGLPVLEMAPFGRNVYELNSVNKNSEKIVLGSIYHMGRVQNTRVELDLNSLTKHVFITGSTGSGKSNTVYQLLNQVKQQNIHFLVIEPAKGEYKNVFGKDEDVHVYGTNPNKTPLLKINPFKFPEDIHVLEHIDRLVEIFNVCWPMYAAMPAVLKNAIERSYVDCGWNLTESGNEYKKYGDHFYPTFADVARNIKIIIDSSEYDAENKGAYKGSLLTRLESLVNGINGQIFSENEIPDKELFDENVIVDLSRVGSSETKSLLMGMLVLKLQEYRMSAEDGMNQELKHITVLEEAHNLLKRTSTEQPTEGGNLLGKSVEMLTNAIAEMRTYGESFVIVDQAPGLLDKAAIRNTNTKIIMSLPDQEDRELVGRSANLNDDQIKELAKLPCGVGAVYQNEWIQPVLCKIDEYKYNSQKFYNYHKPTTEKKKTDVSRKIEIAKYLSKGKKITDVNHLKDIMDSLEEMGLSASEQVLTEQLLSNPPRREPRMTKIAPIMGALFPEVVTKVKECIRTANDPLEWTQTVEESLNDLGINNGNLEQSVRCAIVQGIITDYLYCGIRDITSLKKWEKRMRGVK